jgi:aspartate/methionine/tyrosine aminotransferase
MTYKNSIPYSFLKSNAFNLRWAEVADDVIPLTAADGDLPFSPEISQAIINASENNLFPYGQPQGNLSFRESIAAHFKSNKSSFIHSDQVLATNSAAAAIQDWCYHFLQPGDEVLIPDPVDFLLGYCAEKAGAKVKRIAAEPIWDSAKWQAAITEKTKAIMICHPHNPLGFHYDAESLLSISRFVKENNLMLLSDEVWSDLVWDRSFESMAKYCNQAWIVYGLSKGFGLAGLRIGALIGPNKDEIQSLMDSQGYSRTTHGVSTLSQVAATAALESTQAGKFYRKPIEQTLNHAIQRLASEQSFFQVTRPSATFVLWLKIPKESNAEKLCQRLESEAKVKLVPGLPQWFGPGAEGHVRMSCATSIEVMDEALNRIFDWLKSNT